MSVSVPLQNETTISLQLELLLLSMEEAPNSYFLETEQLVLMEAVQSYENGLIAVNCIGRYSMAMVDGQSKHLIAINDENKQRTLMFLKQKYLQNASYYDWNMVSLRIYIHIQLQTETEHK